MNCTTNASVLFTIEQKWSERQQTLELSHCDLQESLYLVTALLGVSDSCTQARSDNADLEVTKWTHFSKDIKKDLDSHYESVSSEIYDTRKNLATNGTPPAYKETSLEGHSYMNLIKKSSEFFTSITNTHSAPPRQTDDSNVVECKTFSPIDANQKWVAFLEKQNKIPLDKFEADWRSRERDILIEYVRATYSETLSPENALAGWRIMRREREQEAVDIAVLGNAMPGNRNAGETLDTLVNPACFYENYAHRTRPDTEGEHVNEAELNAFVRRANAIRANVKRHVIPIHREIETQLKNNRGARPTCDVDRVKKLSRVEDEKTTRIKCDEIVGISAVAKWMRVMRACSPVGASLYCQALAICHGTGAGAREQRLKHAHLLQVASKNTRFYRDILTEAWQRLWDRLNLTSDKSHGMCYFKNRLLALWYATSAPVSACENKADAFGCVSTIVLAPGSTYPFPPAYCRVPEYTQRQRMIWTMLCVHEQFSVVYSDITTLQVSEVLNSTSTPVYSLDACLRAIDHLHRVSRRTPLLYTRDALDPTTNTVLACGLLRRFKLQGTGDTQRQRLIAFAKKQYSATPVDTKRLPAPSVAPVDRASDTKSHVRKPNPGCTCVPLGTLKRDVAVEEKFAHALSNASTGVLNSIRCLLFAAYARCNTTSPTGSVVPYNHNNNKNVKTPLKRMFVDMWVTVLSLDAPASRNTLGGNTHTKIFLDFLSFLEVLVDFEQQRLEIILAQGCMINVTPMSDSDSLTSFAKMPHVRAAAFLTDWETHMQNITFSVRRSAYQPASKDQPSMSTRWTPGDMVHLSNIFLNRETPGTKEAVLFAHIQEHIQKATRLHMHWKTELEKVRSVNAPARTVTPLSSGDTEKEQLEAYLTRSLAHIQLKRLGLDLDNDATRTNDQYLEKYKGCVSRTQDAETVFTESSKQIFLACHARCPSGKSNKVDKTASPGERQGINNTMHTQGAFTEWKKQLTQVVYVQAALMHIGLPIFFADAVAKVDDDPSHGFQYLPSQGTGPSQRNYLAAYGVENTMCTRNNFAMRLRVATSQCMVVANSMFGQGEHLEYLDSLAKSIGRSDESAHWGVDAYHIGDQRCPTGYDIGPMITQDTYDVAWNKYKIINPTFGGDTPEKIVNIWGVSWFDTNPTCQGSTYTCALEAGRTAANSVRTDLSWLARSAFAVTLVDGVTISDRVASQFGLPFLHVDNTAWKNILRTTIRSVGVAKNELAGVQTAGAMRFHSRVILPLVSILGDVVYRASVVYKDGALSVSTSVHKTVQKSYTLWDAQKKVTWRTLTEDAFPKCYKAINELATIGWNSPVAYLAWYETKFVGFLLQQLSELVVKTSIVFVEITSPELTKYGPNELG
jgi:hypothetical protein